jgi:predicted kinase
MAFEKIVLDKVAKVLKQDRQAGFRNGTLFVWAAESDARRVFSMLCKEYNWKVQVSRVSEQEFAYDFVA